MHHKEKSEIKIVFWAVIAVFAVFLALPMGYLVRQSLSANGSFGLENYAERTIPPLIRQQFPDLGGFRSDHNDPGFFPGLYGQQHRPPREDQEDHRRINHFPDVPADYHLRFRHHLFIRQRRFAHHHSGVPAL